MEKDNTLLREYFKTLIFGFICLIIIILLISYLPELGNSITKMLDSNYTSPEVECKQQCELNGYLFKEYSIGFYSNSVCNCYDDEGVIISIYER